MITSHKIGESCKSKTVTRHSGDQLRIVKKNKLITNKLPVNGEKINDNKEARLEKKCKSHNLMMKYEEREIM